MRLIVSGGLYSMPARDVVNCTEATPVVRDWHRDRAALGAIWLKRRHKVNKIYGQYGCIWADNLSLATP